MDPVTAFVTNVAANIVAGFATDKVKSLFQTAARLHPPLAEDMQGASTTQDVERIFRDLVGVIDAHAGTGAIKMDGALLSALREIRFDHAGGRIHIGNTTIQAPVLVTGGRAGATGETIIDGKTKLKSAGTEIDVGQGAQIKAIGNAQIEQT